MGAYDINQGEINDMHVQNVLILIVGVFICYRIYLRIRRTIGWQPLSPGKMKVVAALSFVIGLLFLIAGASHAASLVSDIAGIAVGVVLACFGAALTRYERREGKWHYRPNTWMGILVTLLFLGRIAYRIYEMYALNAAVGAPAQTSLSGRLAAVGYDAAAPWTSGLMLIMFAYYFTTCIVLFRKQRHLSQSAVH